MNETILLKLMAMLFIAATIPVVYAQEESSSKSGESLIQEIKHFPQTAIDFMNKYTLEKIHQYTAAEAFMVEQFGYWMGANDCEAFTNTFEDGFEYCDGPIVGCVENDRERMTQVCNMLGKMAGGVYKLKVKPYQKSIGDLFDFTQVVVSGKQEAKAMDLSVMCFDFAIRQDLVFTDASVDEDGGDGNQYFTVKSKFWRGYYQMEPGPCTEGTKNPFKKVFLWYIKSQFNKKLKDL